MRNVLYDFECFQTRLKAGVGMKIDHPLQGRELCGQWNLVLIQPANHPNKE